jgi:hypothetical protein
LKYGVVSEETSMKIFPSFKGYDSTATAFAQTTSFFAPDSGYKSNCSNTKFSKSKFLCYRNSNFLRLIFPGNANVNKIQIYLLSGKLLAEFNPQQFRTKEGYQIPMSFFSNYIKTNVVILRIHGDNTIVNQRFAF